MRLSATRLTAVASAIRRAFAQAFSPADLFANGEPGCWYDPSDLTTLFQDAAGTTPVTAVEQPVGLMLDKSRGLVLGPELVVNGDFASGATGWTNRKTGTASTSFTGGLATIVGTDGSNRGWFTQSITTVVGATYIVSMDAVVTSGNAVAIVGTASGSGLVTISSSGAVVARYTATATTTFIGAQTGSGGGSLTFDNISVRELPGNHASQSTATSRPVLSARKNWLVGTDVLATQTTTTRALPYVLSFYGTGTVTLSGTSTAGPLVGTGTNDRVYLEFTPTAGTLTVTVSGVVTKAQLEVANEAA